jgi:hypothetical protein
VRLVLSDGGERRVGDVGVELRLAGAEHLAGAEGCVEVDGVSLQ